MAFYEDKISLDKSGRANGRGAYLCKNKKCVDEAFKKKAFHRAFKKNFNNEEMNSLKREIEMFLETDLKSEGKNIEIPGICGKSSESCSRNDGGGAICKEGQDKAYNSWRRSWKKLHQKT